MHPRKMPPLLKVDIPLSRSLSGNFENDWAFLDATINDIDRNQSQQLTSSKVTTNTNDTCCRTAEEHACHDAQEGCDEGVGEDLSPFITSENFYQDKESTLSFFYKEIDLPLPCTHAEVAETRSAASARAKWRAELRSSDVSFEPAVRSFSRTLCHKGMMQIFIVYTTLPR